MPSCSNETGESGFIKHQNTAGLSEYHESPSKPEMEDNEDEEEDIDFNPFAKETLLSPEASSSLSSEIEGIDGDVVNSSKSNHVEEEEEAVIPTVVLDEGLRENDCRENVVRKEADSDSEDAICTRTRARYSLASFTLDELETFLQETDDEDDLQNVDDEEEYRKFLASVLHGGGDTDGHSIQENDVVDDDDDEDNDADFEIELEELLESDNDETIRDTTEKEYERGRRPETRQNRRQKSHPQYKKKLSTLAIRPLRPLLPVLPNIPPSHCSGQPEAAPLDSGYANGFTQQQIGQLHSLIHEHVQLLIQVFCLSASDCSRQNIASQSQKLILEMLNKQTEVRAWKTTLYPSNCFSPHFLCSSVADNVPKFLHAPHTEVVCSPSNEARFSRGGFEHTSSLQNTEGLFWVPYINGPMVTILDVTPLGLAGKFMNDVEKAVREIRQRQMESSCDDRFEREPLFPFSGYQLIGEANSEVLVRTSPNAIISQQPRKKTLVTTLDESAQKPSAALVPRDITKLAQIFFPLFNPALFPQKPPRPSVANRVLFTESEDELLALGMMEYNTDWKAIKQRFLPCKSEHQIYIRKKNRCSSKAPENSIKAVRRMKASPLTAEEIACIQEALKAYKYDWISVWQFVVPHRDPSLLPRQWRIALGTQTSYKKDEKTKEKRRLYDLNRRRCKSSWQNKEDSQIKGIGGENNDYAGDCADNNRNNNNNNTGKAYVHEAFLADWNPEGAIQEQPQNHNPAKIPNPQGNNFVSTYKQQRPPLHFTNSYQPNSSVSITASNSSKPPIFLRPYRARKSHGTNLVRLAPGLPPVNLPPSVRIVSQSSIRDSLHGASASRESSVSVSRENRSDAFNENTTDSELQMHPLLFQAPEDGRLPYYPSNSYAGNSGSFSFFSALQPHLNLSLSHNPQLEKSQLSSPQGIDFHPLLRKTDYEQSQLPLEKSSELDLEIHLSSSRDVMAHKVNSSQTSNISSYERTENHPSNGINPFTDLPVSGGDEVGRYLNGNGDESHLGIEMEQEELSDSDEDNHENHESPENEENEEKVEFECEEMTDSEGDTGSGGEQTTETHTGEVGNVAGERSTCQSEGSPGKNRGCARGSRAAKSLASSRPSRSCKKKQPNTDEVNGDRRRKSRKRARCNDASFNIQLGQNSNCTGEDRDS